MKDETLEARMERIKARFAAIPKEAKEQLTFDPDRTGTTVNTVEDIEVSSRRAQLLKAGEETWTTK